eukprot:365816-Chlamydomonas_euryale.AAC.4
MRAWAGRNAGRAGAAETPPPPCACRRVNGGGRTARWARTRSAHIPITARAAIRWPIRVARKCPRLRGRPLHTPWPPGWGRKRPAAATAGKSFRGRTSGMWAWVGDSARNRALARSID